MSEMDQNNQNEEQNADEPGYEVIPDSEDESSGGGDDGLHGESNQREENEGEEDSSGASASEVEESHRGGRAQRRIRKLVGERNTLRGALGEAAQVVEDLRGQNKKLQQQLKQNRAGTAEEIKGRLESEEERLKIANTLAVEQDDQEALFAIRQRQAEIAAEKVALRTMSQQQVEEEEEEDQQPPPRQQQQHREEEEGRPPDPQAQVWQRTNPWFGDRTDTQNRIRTAAAILIHEDLINEGFEPGDQPTGGNQQNDYYMELDKRLQKQFPGGNQQQQRQQRTGPVLGGNRAPSSGSGRGGKVRITESELELTKRLGIDPEAYAREKALKAAEGA